MNTATNVLGEGYELCGGRYRIERRLGYGGMASVWLGCDSRLGRAVAIKVLSDTLASDPGYVERFRREARIAAGLSHPNLVKVFDYEPDNRPALVMEYIEGGTLHEASRDAATAVEPEALATQLLGALEHIHSAGIVHRDVKPANVLIDDDGRALLTDFGIAQPEGATRITQTGQVIGTIEYMAPEVREGERATPQSDLYSAGVVLRDHLGDDAPESLRRLVARLTDADPGRRPSSAKRALAYIAGSPSRLAPEPESAVVRTEPMDAPQPDEPPTAEEPLADAQAEPQPAEPQPRETDEWDALSAPLADTGPRGPSAGEGDPRGLPGPPPRRREHAIDIRHVLAGLALLAAAVIVIVIATSGSDSDDPSPGRTLGGAEGQAAEEPQPTAEEPAAEEPAQEPAPTTSSAPIPEPKPNADPEKGVQLNDEAFTILGSGDAEGAVKAYEKALAEFPAETRTPEAFDQYPQYAYALYSYGDALLQTGRAEEAVAVLEERLAFEDQRETVEALHAEAEAAAGG